MLKVLQDGKKFAFGAGEQLATLPKTPTLDDKMCGGRG